jgi:predicted ATPase
MTRISEREVLDLLTRLVEKSLVMYDEDEEGHGRYRLLETVRAYGRALLVANVETEGVRRRHAEYFLTLAGEAEPYSNGTEQDAWLQGLDVWLNRMKTEHDNLRTALEWRYEQQVATARAPLCDDPAFARAWQEGHAITMEQAIAHALEEGDG